jgi:long-chain acyl-CoA synthetase
MATQQAVADAWLNKTGCVLSEAYGLLETSPALTCNRFDSKDFSGTIGVPLPSTHISIRDENNDEVPLGEAGEICAKGPQLMAGYWNKPEETAKVMTSDGYFRTGDIGMMTPNGSIKIVDRKKDMILVSGFNVYPNEVENAIASHSGVLECVVIGVKDARSGEAVKAFIVARDPNVTADDIIKFCATQLASYKARSRSSSERICRRPMLVRFCAGKCAIKNSWRGPDSLGFARANYAGFGRRAWISKRGTERHPTARR